MVRARDVSGGSQQPEVFRAFIRSTYDALLMFEAALSGRIPRVTRRFNYNEKRDDIKSGSTYVFGEEEAEIKRWTGTSLWFALSHSWLQSDAARADGLTWSPSRINKNFLVRPQSPASLPHILAPVATLSDTHASSDLSRAVRSRRTTS